MVESLIGRAENPGPVLQRLAEKIRAYLERQGEKKSDLTVSREERGRLKGHWLELYRWRFGHEYEGADSARFNRVLKDLHEMLGAAKAAQMMRFYVQWNDPWIAKKGHPLDLLISNLHALQASVHRPEAMMKSVAQGRAAERVLTEREQREREVDGYLSRKGENGSGGRDGLRGEVPHTPARGVLGVPDQGGEFALRRCSGEEDSRSSTLDLGQVPVLCADR